MDPNTERRIAEANLITRNVQLDRIFGDDLSRRLLDEIAARKEGRMAKTSDNRVVTDIATEKVMKPISEGRSRRGLVAALAGAAVVLATLGVFLFRGGEPLATSPSPIEVVQGFVEARNAHDAASMQSFLADGVIIGGDLVTSKDDVVRLAGYERAVGWQFDLGTCVDLDLEPATVICPYSWTSDASQALGNGFIAGSSFRAVVGEEGITQLTNNFDYGGYVAVESQLHDWLEETHPEDFDTMVDRQAPIGLPPLLTDESIALWEEYTEEFVRSQGG